MAYKETMAKLDSDKDRLCKEVDELVAYKKQKQAQTREGKMKKRAY